MKVNFKFLAIVTFLGLLHSCSNDDDSPVLNAPTITNFEYGEGSTHSDAQVAYKGSDIHFAAAISAEATVSSIVLDIHAHDLVLGEGEVEWDYEQVFTDSEYLAMNPEFHEHIEVPADIPGGEYHLTLTVTDELGNSTEIEGHIDILDPIELSEIFIDPTVVRGTDFHAEFIVLAVNGIHTISVDAHAHGIEPGDGEMEWHYEQIFEEGYHDQTEVEFHQHIDVPATAPVGEYHIVFTVADENGNTKAYDTHLEVTAE
tara:strand:- start:77474 stop:78247 length:774 start_codon:yes stop_codon:yes gene_type:complete